MYELVLWFQGHEDVRITDQPASVGQTLVIDDIRAGAPPDLATLSVAMREARALSSPSTLG